MRSSIALLSEIPPEWLVDYFRSRQVPEATTRWKFLEPLPGAGSRERGLAWVRDGAVQGFLGLIPTQLGRGGRTWPMSWTCDWSLADRKAAPGVGVRLLQRAMETVSQLFYVTRGSAHTESLAPRMAHHTVDDAAVAWILPLRLGSLLELAGRRAPALHLDEWPLLPRVPLRRARRASLGVRVEAGVARALGPLLEEPRGSGWYPAYDWATVEWLVGRCPVLECASVYAPASGPPRAAVLLWHLRASRRRWRFAAWARPDAADLLAAVIDEALGQAQRGGGWLASVLLSRRDAELESAVRASGWALRRPPQPLFALVTKDPCVDELGNLSFLDADLAYQI